jgi:hypothetical protein
VFVLTCEADVREFDDVRTQVTGRGFGLDAGDEPAARRAHHLDLDVRKAFVEPLDDQLLGFQLVRRVQDDRSFLTSFRDEILVGGELRIGRRGR